MVTVNGRKLGAYLEQQIGKGANSVFKDTVFESSVSNHTRHNSYSILRRAHNRSLHDPKVKNGKTKIYTHGEVHIMNQLDTLAQFDKQVYDIILDSKEPIGIKGIQYKYTKAYGLTEKTRQMFVTVIENLYKLRLVKKLTLIKGVAHSHEPGKRLYLEAIPAHEVLSVPKHPLTKEVAEKAESQPAPAIEETTLTADIHATINDWMDANNVAEFSISIRKRE